MVDQRRVDPRWRGGSRIEYGGRFAGHVTIAPQNGWRSHVGEIGYWIGRRYWGKGIATAALAAMSEYGFMALGLKKLRATVLAPNVASMRVLEKCGYVREGVLKSEVQKGGVYFDLHHFAKEI